MVLLNIKNPITTTINDVTIKVIKLREEEDTRKEKLKRIIKIANQSVSNKTNQ